MLRRRVLLAVVAVGFVAPSLPTLARDLTFEERVAAQRAIERVYYQHRDGGAAPFEQAVSDGVLAAKVRRTLERSVALEQFWNRPITSEMLRRETERMVRDSRMPERLDEVFAALDRDAFLIQETLARAHLADRLVHGYFAVDDRIHADARREAEQIRSALLDGRLDPRASHARRVTMELHRGTGESAFEVNHARTTAIRVELDDAGFAGMRQRLARHPDGIAPLREERGAFVVDVLLGENAGDLQVARFAVPKTTLDAWWPTLAPKLDARSLRAVATPAATLPAGPGSPYTFNDEQSCSGSWRELAGGMPQPRLDHTAVWTGAEMIVWGGWPSSSDVGERYDPATDSWAAVSNVGAPQQRVLHTAVWTGSEMIVWGGHLYNTLDFPVEGGRYDPLTDQWAPTSTMGAPGGRRLHAAVWTGAEMIVWGGEDNFDTWFDTGGRYDPETDSWSATSTTNAPAARLRHTAVWTGSAMIVWGGGQDFAASEGDCPDVAGGRYDPATDTWMPTSTIDAPSPRAFHGAAWTGTEMLVWGGTKCSRGDRIGFDTGARYDPETDSWTATSTTGAPAGRLYPTTTWAGDRLLIWGGSSGETFSQITDTLDSGGAYDPATDSWTPTATTNAPTARSGHTAVWAGDELIVWGGYDSGEQMLDTGGRYRPATDSWTPTAAANAPLVGRGAVWTGSELIVWGDELERFGDDPVVIEFLSTGGRYDPATDSWMPTTTINAPDGRFGPTAVWSGTEAIVFGGADFQNALDTGGRYDPLTDSWTATSSTNALALSGHTAVWTGEEMIVWGGDVLADSPVGGRYDPADDSWTQTSATNAPDGRFAHTAVWTGSEMVIWGGATCCFTWVNDGGRYDPATDSWSPTALTAAPDIRSDHTAVWTDMEMLVWGGYFRTSTDRGNYDDGGRYDPATDSWTPISTVDAPEGRGDHTAVWTGAEMIVWSGNPGSPNLIAAGLETGGRYDPATDGWTPTSTVDSPQGRRHHVAAWTGSEMLVFGGVIGLYRMRDGATLDPTAAGPDADHDGFCALADCDDGNPATYPGAGEVNDGQDNQCPGDPGFGMVDEIDGEFGFDGSPDKDVVSWEPQPGATSYDVARSTAPDFSTACTSIVVPTPQWRDTALPPPGAIFHYLVRAFSPNTGSWGRTSDGTPRTACD